MKFINVLFLFFLTTHLVEAQPHDGQIVVDPNHRNRLIYHNQSIVINNKEYPKPCILIGPGDPEDFFYNNTKANLELLKSKGAKCTYITAFLADFGGGNPGSEQQADSVLNLWDTYITELEEANIAVVFFFFDDAYALPGNWKFYVKKIVEKLKNHKLLIWSVAEEYKEALTSSQVSEVARYIAGIDNHDHVIGVHQNHGTAFDFNNDTTLQMFNIQYNVNSPDELNKGMKNAFDNTAGLKILNMAELVDHAKKDITAFNRINWAAIMGGASIVQVLRMGRATDDPTWNSDEKYNACAAASNFLSKTNINQMIPANHLALGSTKYLLAAEGYSYLLYCQDPLNKPGLRNVAHGNYSLAWFQVKTGKTMESEILIPEGDFYFTPPAGLDGDLVCWISNMGVLEPSTLKKLHIAPNEAFILTNQPFQFKASAFDQYNQNFKAGFVWYVESGGTINDNGLFTGNGDEGDHKLICYSAENKNIRDTSVIHVFSKFPAPKVKNKNLAMINNGYINISLEYTNVTPGPFEIDIIESPKNGSLSISNNDAIYTPNPGFSGQDKFRWAVTDTRYHVTSDTVTVFLTIYDYQQGWYYCQEAENYDTISNVSFWNVKTDIPDYSGESFLTATGSGTVSFEIDFPAKGSYYLYVRNYATSSENNGFHLVIDGVQITGTKGIDGVIVVKKSTWNWGTQFQYGKGDHHGPVKVEINKAGKHVIGIKGRDLGFRFDKLIVTDQKIDNKEVDGTEVPYFLDRLNGIPLGYYGKIK